MQKLLQIEGSIIDVRWLNFILLSVIILSFMLQVFSPLLNNGNLKRNRINYFKFLQISSVSSSLDKKPDSC